MALVTPSDELTRGVDILRREVVDRIANNSSNNNASTATRSASTSTSRKQFVVLPLPVNYVAQCVRGVAYTHADAPALTLLAPLLRVYLHAGSLGGGAGTMDLFCFVLFCFFVLFLFCSCFGDVNF
jgi:Zn-dependent M16 (insulinase) family peptidase